MQQPRSAAARVITARRLVAGVQLAESRAVVPTLGILHGALDRAQLRIAVEHELDGLAVGRLEVLGDVRDREAGRHLDRARLRLQITAHEGEQARLAAAVRASDADLLATEERERCSRDELPRPAAEGYVVEPKH